MLVNLVIVESPAKAKTIKKYLGKDYIVKSSIGHIRDLPQSAKKTASKKVAKTKDKPAVKTTPEQKLFTRMGINPLKNWEASYQIIPGKEKVAADLRKTANQCSSVYLATDMDREGEAIAWHLQEILGKKHNYHRVVFNEITRTSIKKAFEKPTTLNLDIVHAQHARRFLDRVVGFMLSPLLWKKVARGLSAGRVQSVAVRIIVEREQQINAFIAKEYWLLDAKVKTASDDALGLHLIKHKGKSYKHFSKEQIDIACKELKDAQYKVEEYQLKDSYLRPNAPFITSTLQQIASTKLGFSVKKTMTIAQKLYEGGFITYMRTDSTNLSSESINECRSYIKQKFTAPYLPKEVRIYAKQSAHAQQAHEAIRPTNVALLSSDINLDPNISKLYALIWQRFVGCQMADAKFHNANLNVTAADYILTAKGRKLVFDGFTKVIPQAKEDGMLEGNFIVGDELKLIKLLPSQHFTKPPSRYSEAGLVKELEKMGIGRPSTYANIISTIQDRGYVSLINKRMHALKIGEIVTNRLIESFNDLMDFSFTAKMEDSLDEIAAQKLKWQTVLDKFYANFSTQLLAAEKQDQGMRANLPTPVDIKCPKCSSKMMVVIASSGMFLSCSSYASATKTSERCKQTINLQYIEDETTSENQQQQEYCPKCQAAINHYIAGSKHKLTLCSNLPDCTESSVEAGVFDDEDATLVTMECDKCKDEMILKSGRFGEYFACNSCDNKRRVLSNGEVALPKITPVDMLDLKCKKCDDHYVLRDGAAGLFLAASKFPKHRETRSPLLIEILPYKDKIDKKYSYLFTGPMHDPKANETIIRFDKKLKQIYLGSIKDNTLTKWKSYYDQEIDKWLTKK